MNDQIKTKKDDFAILGIGASAGGLEALEVFLHNVPENSGMAFIVVQHQDPKRKGILVELLQRATSMPVILVNNDTTVQPNSVYVIPPNKNMSIHQKTIHIEDFDHQTPRRFHLSIDYFLRTLAEDQQEKSIGIILSGMGTDGTLGIRAIKEKGGAVFVQEPASAKFDSMPRNAIETGLADVISPVGDLPSKVLSYLKHKPSLDHPNMENTESSAYDKIMNLLRSQTGQDFSSYKQTTVCRRIERRMGIHQIDKVSTYVLFLQNNPQELDLLFKELLIGVTNFFREPAEWELLKDKVIPSLLVDRAPSHSLRAWVSACATGEEAYSLAIVFKEVMEQLQPAQNFTLQIFATDLDRDAIDKAREAVFPTNIETDVSPERLRKYFVKVDRGYQVAQSIRDMVIFAPQNLIMDPPFTKLDILCCRNLLIYFSMKLQKKLMPLFHYSLNPEGFLFLGSAETVGNFTELFEPLHRKSRIYQRLQSHLQTEPVGFPAFFVAQSVASKDMKPVQNIQSLADQLILQRYSPPTVLVNSKGDIIYITGRTGKYLEPAAGKANWNIFAMTREGLHYELSDTFQKALHQKKPVTYRNAILKSNGAAQAVDITVQPLQEPEALRGMVLVVFQDVVTPREIIVTEPSKPGSTYSQREVELERELMQVRQELHVTRTEMQTSHEELKSFNEELQSTNEELQSTNEELTTSKEELQSLNEELQTVNYELQTKVDELSLSKNDMKNLMDSTQIATLFLDKALCVRRFTSQMSVITKLRPGDVGRPVIDIASSLFYQELTDDVRAVLSTLNTMEKQVISGNGRWFNLRILPYRTLEDKIDGVVVTFVDITAFKELEVTLLNTQSALEGKIQIKNNEIKKAKERFEHEVQLGQRETATGKASKQVKEKMDE